MPWNICRICLAGDKKMYSVANTKLLDIFEKVTGNVWEKDKRPSTLCYLCFYQLAKCLKLREMAKQSEDIFVQIFAGGLEFTEETAPILNERKLHKYMMTPVQDFSVGVCVDTIEVTIKKEDAKEISVEESSMDLKDSANCTQVEHTIKNVNDGTPVKDLVKDDPNIAIKQNNDHETENMDVVMKSQDDEGIRSDKENGIAIQNEDKISSNEPKTLNKEHELIENKTNNKNQTKPKRNVYFTLKFNTSNSLQNSKEKLNVSDDRIGYKCKYCQKSYKVRYGLEKHLRTHEENLYQCEYCSKTFHLKSVLKLHEETHTKRSLRKASLSSNHDRSQKEESHLKYYKCELCNKSFNQLSHLQQHMRTHTGVRPYKCDICGKGFKQLSNLKQHNRVHSGDKPYQCNFCSKTFGQLSNLEQHKRKHHAE